MGMATMVQVGTIFIEDRPLIMRPLDLESEPYSGTWGVLQSLTSFTLDQKIRSAGWKRVSKAGEFKVTVLGALAAQSIRRALKQIFLKVRKPDLNCLEVTRIVEDHFMGMRCTTVCAHSRHIHQGSIMELADELKNVEAVLPVIQDGGISMKNLYVGNLADRTTEPQLRTLFEAHGTVERVSLVVDKETGRSKGFAFVEMKEASEADKACLALSGSELDGRALRVNEAKAKSH
jgi:hypothetical protein